MSLKFVDLYPDEDQARLDELEAAAERAKSNKTDLPLTMGEVDPYIEAAQARDAFAQEIVGRRIRVVMRHQPRKAWRALMLDHKPRGDSEDDKPFGVNMETLPDVLVPLSIDREQSENLPGDIDTWLDSLSDIDYYDRLFVTAFAANRGRSIADPTQRLLSEGSQISSETSN